MNHLSIKLLSAMGGGTNKDYTMIVSLVLSVVSLGVLFGVTWYSLALLQQQAKYDQELLFKLQEQINGVSAIQ